MRPAVTYEAQNRQSAGRSLPSPLRQGNTRSTPRADFWRAAPALAASFRGLHHGEVRPRGRSVSFSALRRWSNAERAVQHQLGSQKSLKKSSTRTNALKIKIRSLTTTKTQLKKTSQNKRGRGQELLNNNKKGHFEKAARTKCAKNI